MEHTRYATAVWKGTGLEGSGRMNTPRSGAIEDLPYSTKARFENADGRAGTNPEELIAAAHAACFTMALSFGLSGDGLTPEELKTEAQLTIEKEPDGSGWTVTAVHLEVEGKVPGIDESTFKEKAEAAKDGCPVSRLLNAEITVSATLS